MLQLLHVLRIDLTKYLSIKYPSIYRYLQIVIDFFYKCSVYHSFLCRWWKRSFTDAENWPLTKKKQDQKTVWLPDSTKKISFWRCSRTGGSYPAIREMEKSQGSIDGGRWFCGAIPKFENLHCSYRLWLIMNFYDVYDICVTSLWCLWYMCVCVFPFGEKKHIFRQKHENPLVNVYIAMENHHAI